MFRSVVLALVFAVAALGAFGQENVDPENPPPSAQAAILPGASYTVATIRPSNPDETSQGVETRADGAFHAISVDLKRVVCGAYGAMPFECEGGPAWFESDLFDVDAKPDAATQAQLSKLDPTQRHKVEQSMLQALLIDRLKLRVHWETKVMPAFALEVTEGGSKLKEARAGDAYANGLRAEDGQPLGAGSFGKRNGEVVAQGVSMDGLARLLSRTVFQAVLNETGLKGNYDFKLRYVSDELATNTSDAPSLTSALRDQLGLKLESKQAEVRVLVIDHVEPPPED